MSNDRDNIPFSAVWTPDDFQSVVDDFNRHADDAIAIVRDMQNHPAMIHQRANAAAQRDSVFIPTRKAQVGDPDDHPEHDKPCPVVDIASRRRQR